MRLYWESTKAASLLFKTQQLTHTTMKRSHIVALTIITALVIVGIVLLKQYNTSPAMDTSTGARNTPATADTTGDATNPPVTTPKPTSTTTTSVGKLSYNDALKKYAGQRLQFVNCTTGPSPVSPSSLSLKKGDDFMLDNRDPKAHTIKVGTYSYKVGANSFTVANAPATRGDYNVTCDGGGAAKIYVQP